MKKFVVVAMMVLLFPLSAFAWQGVVAKVVDGDTIWVETKEKSTKIRLYGIDAPESKQAYGAEATAAVEALVLGKTVTVIDIEVDRYGRDVSIVVMENGLSLQEALLYAGHVWLYTEYCKSEICNVWRVLEKDARENKRGLWAAPTPPWEWRKK